MNDEERNLINAWVEKLAAALDVADVPFAIDEILGLAGAAARSVVRPAAPLTTFIAGYAAGLAAATGIEPKRAMQQAIGTAESLSATA